MDNDNDREFIKRFTQNALSKKAQKTIGTLLSDFDNNEKKDKSTFIVVISLLVIFIVAVFSYECFQKPDDLVSTKMVKITELIKNKRCSRIIKNTASFIIDGKIIHASISCNNNSKVNDIVKVGYFYSSVLNKKYCMVLDTNCGIKP